MEPAPHPELITDDNLPPSNDRHFSEQDSSNIVLAKLRGMSVIWRIWPAVLLHAAFATVIVSISNYTTVKFNIPNIMLTLLGVVIGFVVSLRVSSGHDRYWWGRCAWSDLIKNSRTMSRLIWIHLPPRLSITSDSSLDRSSPEKTDQAMREKRMMMDLVEAFPVSLKHYVRGELGIYYEDLYPIVRPFHEHRVHSRDMDTTQENAAHQNDSCCASTANSSRTHLLIPFEVTALVPQGSGAPSINSYGSTVINKSRPTRSHVPDSSKVQLLPAELSLPSLSPSPDLIPFGSFLVKMGGFICHLISPYTWYTALRDFLRNQNAGDEETEYVDRNYAGARRHLHSVRGGCRSRAARRIHHGGRKHQPRLAGDGENLPLEIIRCMSEWVCVLESRGVASGNVIGGIYGCIAAYEDVLGTLERIITTPLPYVYSQHIRHTVWLYLFFLPFQLAEDFQWSAIPGVTVAAFFYLGFLAAGDEIEQPFGYDEDDLDLGLFCREIIKADLQMLMATPCANASTSSQRFKSEIVETRTVVELCAEDAKKGKHVDDENEDISIDVA